jgi:hypothetical protein
MILNYTEPQLNIDQQLAVELDPTTPRQAACIVGTQYESPGFTGDFSEKVFSTAGDTFELSFTRDENLVEVDSLGLVYKLDESSLDILVKDAEFELVDPSNFDEDNGIDAVKGTRNNIAVTSKNLRVAGDGVLWSALEGRPVSLGDTVLCYNTYTGGTPVRRKVTGFIGKPVASTVGSNTEKDDTLFAAANSNPVARTTSPQMGVPTGVEFNPSEITASGNLTTSGAQPTDWASNGNNPNRVVNMQGHSFTVDGVTYAGLSINIAIVSFNTISNSGNARVTSSNGVINTLVTFTVVDSLVTFNFAGIVSLTGFSGFEATLFPEQLPQVGDSINFRYYVDYTPVESGSMITSGQSVFTGSVDNTYYVKVTQGSYQAGDTAIVQIYDARGSFTPFTRSIPYGTTDLEIAISSGVEVELDYVEIKDLPQKGLHKNDIYFINAVAAKTSATEFTTLILDGPVTHGGVLTNIKLRGTANGSVKGNQPDGDGFSLDVSKTSVTYNPNLFWKVSGRNEGSEFVELVNTVGTIYSNWKAAKTPLATENKVTIRNLDDVKLFGPIVPENDLAFGVYTAWKASPNQIFFALRTASDSAEDIAKALEKIESTDQTYALGILSDNVSAFSAAVDHAESMSAKTVKNFRRVYFGVDVPSEFAAISTYADGTQLKATITEYDGVNRLVSFTEDAQLTAKDVFPGDIVRIFGNDFVVQQVISDYELIITAASAPNLEISPAVDATIFKKNSPENQVEYVSELAKSIRNRRGVLIWSDSPVGVDAEGNQFTLPVKFLGAEIAARRAALRPQLGLTKTQVTSVIETPAMYSRYTRNLLNEAAANGVMIVMQDNEGAQVVVRHQLTTDVDSGRLYYEDSVGVNVDNLSLQIKDALEKFVGKRNVTPTTLAILNHEVFLILDNARTTTVSDLDIGPQIINFYDADKSPGKVTVINHPTFRDRVIVKVTVAIPLPMNVIEVELEAISEVVVAA